MANSFHIKSLRLNNTSVHFDINHLTFEHGIHAIIGPNGSGKTTFLRGLIGYYKNTSKREVYINEHIISRAEYISYMPQEMMRFNVTPNDYLNITLGTHNDYDDILKRFRLFDKNDQSIELLSSGEFKRLQFVQMCIEDEPVMLFDELEQGLDMEFKRMLMDELKDFSRKKVIIMTFHDINLALQYADTLSIFKNGQLTHTKITPSDLTDDVISKLYETPLNIVCINNQRIVVPN